MTAPRRLLRPALAGIALFMLAGCPSGDGSSTPAAAPAPAASPTSAPVAAPSSAPPAAAPAPSPPSTDDAPAAGAPTGAPAGVLSSDGAFYIVYRITPEPLPLNELFSIDVEVYDAGDHETLLSDLELAVDGRMPDHRHGMNREPKVVRNDDGSFTVTGMLFHMPGFWELHFDVSRVGTTERALVEIDLE